MKKITYLFMFPFLHTFLYGQDSLSVNDNNTSEYTKTIFRSTQIINTQTTETIRPDGIEFNIKHRFGYIQPDETAVTEFLGLDLPANIRLGFAFPLTKNAFIGIGRTKQNKTYDFEGKYLLIRQGSKFPLAIAIYFNTSIMTEKFPRIPDNAYFADGTTAFKFKFNHRLAYNSQIIIARNFGDKFSLQIASVIIHRNLVPPGQKNNTLVIPFGGAIQTGLSSSIIFEYSYLLNNQPDNNTHPASIGWEVGTPGHSFQLFMSSSPQILEQQLYSLPFRSYRKGNFLFGFNIKRVF